MGFFAFAPTVGGDFFALSFPPLSFEELLPEHPSILDNRYAWPAQGTLTSGFGDRRNNGRKHKGIDIANAVGTPIYAAAPGEVVFSGWNSGGYGNLVILEHQNGDLTYYAHNNRNRVLKGQYVERGQFIAEMGNTGYSSGSHLHFEIRQKVGNANRNINPLIVLNSIK